MPNVIEINSVVMLEPPFRHLTMEPVREGFEPSIPFWGMAL